MRQFTLRRTPTYAEVIERRLADAEIELLDAQSEFERAKANLTMFDDRVSRLKTIRDEQHAKDAR